MAGKKSPERIQAERLYLESGGTRKLVDIAAELGKSDSLIRKWKNADKWEDKLKGALLNRKGNVTESKRNRGGQPGNTNAKGHGAPAGNINALDHGNYQSIYWDTLSDEELKYIGSLPVDDEESMLVNEIALHSVRIRKLMLSLTGYEDGAELALDQVEQRTMTAPSAKPNQGEYKETETTTTTISRDNKIQNIDKLLLARQRARADVVLKLAKLRENNAGDKNEKENNLLEMIQQSAGGDYSEIQEIQPQAESDDDMVGEP